MTKMLTIAETPTFKNQVDDYFDAQHFDEFKTYIALNPFAGDVMPGSEGVRKLRWAAPGGGKSGGYRILYVFNSDQNTIWLLMIYAKKDRSAIGPKEARQLKP